jgi:tRNA dimethylallyltransferase
MTEPFSAGVSPVLIVAGPTASGKSRLALALAEAFEPATVINADSMQVYRELPVLTARPGAEALAAAPHRLYGVMSAAERCSAGRWRAMAETEIAAAQRAGRLPIVVGGTGLYLRALMRGLAPVPEIPAELRAAAADRLERLGAPELHAELVRRDPASAAGLRPGDAQRVRRAWEVLEATGRSLKDWQREGEGAAKRRFLAFALMPPRSQLYDSCNARFLAMIEAGAVEEARQLRRLGLDPALPAMKALGLREILAHIDGKVALADAVAAAQQSTRRYAKRQVTWFRHQLPEAELVGESVYNQQDMEGLCAIIIPKIRGLLLTR